MIGRNISHFKLLEKIGEGGMGVVYKAQDIRLHRLVAIKVLPDHLTSNQVILHRFTQEAQAASALNHPNICTIHDVGEENGVHFIVMELIEGQTLRQVLEERGLLPEQEVIEIGIKICEGMAAAHAKGIIHRDIKPENIMISEQGLLKVMDFGLAKLVFKDEDQSNAATAEFIGIPSRSILKTSLSTFQGTASYMAPEQIRKETIDKRTDVFSMGVVLCELLTGIPPFVGRDSTAVMKSILKDTPKPLSESKSDVSPETAAAIQKAIHKLPSMRHANPAALGRALQRSATIRGRKPRKQRIFTTAVASLLVLVGLAFSMSTLKGWLTGDIKNAILFSSVQTKAIGLTSEIEKWPAFSPDGKQIIYTSAKLGPKALNPILKIKDLETGQIRDFIHPFQNESELLVEAPDWSPDGRWIAFSGSGICIVDTGGQIAERIVNFGFGPNWSPDGKRIVFSTRESSPGADNDILVYNFLDSTYRQVSPDNGVKYTYADWSPDGRWIVCIGGERGFDQNCG